jgi:hypothetical protein
MMMGLLVLQIFPSLMGMIAIYVILYRIGGLDRLWQCGGSTPAPRRGVTNPPVPP